MSFTAAALLLLPQLRHSIAAVATAEAATDAGATAAACAAATPAATSINQTKVMAL